MPIWQIVFFFRAHGRIRGWHVVVACWRVPQEEPGSMESLAIRSGELTGKFRNPKFQSVENGIWIDMNQYEFELICPSRVSWKVEYESKCSYVQQGAIHVNSCQLAVENWGSPSHQWFPRQTDQELPGVSIDLVAQLSHSSYWGMLTINHGSISYWGILTIVTAVVPFCNLLGYIPFIKNNKVHRGYYPLGNSIQLTIHGPSFRPSFFKAPNWDYPMC
jgi:hypothetical protein